jgi:hypothetical protein
MGYQRFQIRNKNVIPNLRYFARAIVELGRSRGGRVEPVEKAAIGLAI